jgi:hypothetical protein
MFKILPAKSEPHYSEIFQPNPIRFHTLKETEEPGVYQIVSGKWKCKDFMNEAVYSYHTGKSASIYGFQSSPQYLNKNSDHFPLLAHITAPFDVYENNIALVNDWLIEEGCDPVEVNELEAKTDVLVKLPLQCLENTYFMSVYTLLIRLANVNKKFDKVEDLFTNQPSQEKGLIKTLFKKPPSQFPDEQRDYAMLYNGKINGCFILKSDPKTWKGVNIDVNHDCGLQNWGGDSTKFKSLSEMKGSSFNYW